MVALTDNGEVEGSLTEAVVVSQFNGVAAAVLLLATCNGQLTATVAALDRDVGRTLLDLQGHVPQSTGLLPVCMCLCVSVCVSVSYGLSEL